MTSFELPRLDNPAVKAKGTVRPSAKPIIMSRTMSPWSEWVSLATWASWGERVSMLGWVDMMTILRCDCLAILRIMISIISALDIDLSFL